MCHSRRSEDAPSYRIVTCPRVTRLLHERNRTNRTPTRWSQTLAQTKLTITVANGHWSPPDRRLTRDVRRHAQWRRLGRKEKRRWPPV